MSRAEGHAWALVPDDPEPMAVPAIVGCLTFHVASCASALTMQPVLSDRLRLGRMAMTRIFVLVATFGLGFAGWQSTASANVNDVNLTVALLAADQCAVEVELVDVVGNQFNGSEQLRVGADVLGTFSGLVGVYSNLSPGDRILFASAAFIAATGFAADVQMADTVCALLVAGAVVEFYGSFGPLAGNVTLPAGFLQLFAVSTALGLIDLQTAALLLYSLTGDLTVGTGDPANPGGGGCAVAHPTGGGGGALAFLVAGLALLSLRRRRRRRSA